MITVHLQADKYVAHYRPAPGDDVMFTSARHPSQEAALASLFRAMASVGFKLPAQDTIDMYGRDDARAGANPS